VSVEAVVGRRDVIARRHAVPPDHVIDGGHLDYLGSPEFRELAARAVARLRAADVPEVAR
jgi:hypothetical protein